MRTSFFVLCSLICFNLAAQINLTSSLSACYQLNGNANDPVNLLNGTLSAVTSTVDRFNNANSAYLFNGSTSSYISLPNSTLLKANAVSFSGWVKHNVVGSYIVFAHNGCGSYYEGYAFGTTSSNFHLAKSAGCSNSLQITLTGTVPVSSGTWYHVGFYVGPDSMKIYVNGVLDKSLANTNGLVYNTNANVYLGGTNLSPNYPFSGTIDNARFYNRKLSDSEMYALYSQDPACSVSGFPPVSSFSANPSSLCAGNSIALTDLSSNTPTSWNWQITGAASMSSSVNNPTLTLSNPGNYIISLVSTNANGAGNTFTQSITVKPNPTITVSASNVACLGQTVTLTASGASTYSWNSGPTGATIAVSPAQNTTYSVIGTSTNGCLGFAPKTITVFAPPVLAISGNSIICEGASTSLLVSGSALTYTWTNNFTGNLVSVSPAVSTSYSVSGTDVNGCIGVASQVVVVNSSPIVMANATSTAICVGDAALLNGSGASTYAWSGGVQNNIPFFPNTTAIYSVTGTGTNGCKKTATMQVHVNSLPVLSLTSNSSMAICPGEPVILSATGANLYSWSSGQVLPVITINPTVTTQFTVTGTDANGCKSSLMYTQNVYACLGLESGSPDGGVFIYPNPAFEEIHVVIPGGAGPLRLELYTASGSKLREYAVTAPQSIVKLSEYSPGVYTIRLYRGNALIGLKKLVKSQH